MQRNLFHSIFFVALCVPLYGFCMEGESDGFPEAEQSEWAQKCFISQKEIASLWQKKGDLNKEDFLVFLEQVFGDKSLDIDRGVNNFHHFEKAIQESSLSEERKKSAKNIIFFIGRAPGNSSQREQPSSISPEERIALLGGNNFGNEWYTKISTSEAKNQVRVQMAAQRMQVADMIKYPHVYAQQGRVQAQVERAYQNETYNLKTRWEVAGDAALTIASFTAVPFCQQFMGNFGAGLGAYAGQALGQRWFQTQQSDASLQMLQTFAMKSQMLQQDVQTYALLPKEKPHILSDEEIQHAAEHAIEEQSAMLKRLQNMDINALTGAIPGFKQMSEQEQESAIKQLKKEKDEAEKELKENIKLAQSTYVQQIKSNIAALKVNNVLQEMQLENNFLEELIEQQQMRKQLFGQPSTAA